MPRVFFHVEFTVASLDDGQERRESARLWSLMSEGVEELSAITGLDAGQAFVLLEAAGGDLAVAVQLHFDNEEGMNRPGNSAADEAAARAAQMDEDAANYGGHYGGSSDEDDGDDHADFPEPVPDDDDDGGGGDAEGEHSSAAVPDTTPVPAAVPAEGESLGSHPLTSNRISAPAGMSSVATSHSRWRTRSVHCGRSDGHTSRRAFGAALEGAAKIAGAIGPLKDECSHSPSTNV